MLSESQSVTFVRTKKGYAKEERPSKGGSKGGSNRMMAEINSSTEKSTLGDLDVLSQLKASMEAEPAEEAKAKEKPAKKAAAKKLLQ